MDFDVKITTKFWPLDLVFPYKCRGCGRVSEPVCGCCKNYIISNVIGEVRDAPEVSVAGLDGLFVVGEREGTLAKMIKDYKFKSVRRLSYDIAEVLAAAIPSGRLEGEVVVVPLPTISKHIRERGFDHTAVLARRLAKLGGWRYSSLLRRRNRTVQVGKDAETRRRQAGEAYEVSGVLDSEKTYLLVDDVWTTGATMSAAAKKLREAGASKVYAVVACKGMR